MQIVAILPTDQFQDWRVYRVVVKTRAGADKAMWGIWWACSDHRSEAQRRRNAARGTGPKAPGAPEPAQDSLFGERE